MRPFAERWSVIQINKTPAALSASLRAREADLLRRLDRSLCAACHRGRAGERSRRDRRHRPQRRRRAGAGGDHARARARWRCRPARTAAGAADAGPDRARSGAASAQRSCAQCSRGLRSSRRLPGSMCNRARTLQFLGLRSGRRLGIKLDRERCNPIVWKVRFHEMLSYDFYRRLRLTLPPALPVHHGDRPARPTTLFACWSRVPCRSPPGQGPAGDARAFLGGRQSGADRAQGCRRRCEGGRNRLASLAAAMRGVCQCGLKIRDRPRGQTRARPRITSTLRQARLPTLASTTARSRPPAVSARLSSCLLTASPCTTPVSRTLDQ